MFNRGKNSNEVRENGVWVMEREGQRQIPVCEEYCTICLYFIPNSVS